jgi:CDK5 regulatory subunit-associated protein 3
MRGLLHRTVSKMDPVNCQQENPVLLRSSETSETRLPLLRYLLEHGNVTCFEYHSGVKPAVIENSEFELALKEIDEDDKLQTEKEDEVSLNDITLYSSLT